MAMARSSAAAPLLLLLSVLVSTAAAARTVGDAVQDACSKSQFPKICLDSLLAKPESQKACPRKLAELFVNIAAEKGARMATFVQGKYNNAKDNSLFKCYDSCSDDVEEAVAHLNGLVREPTDAKFLELKSWLSSTLGGTSTCEDACKDAPQSTDKDEVVNYSFEFEKLQRVTLDLITEASGSMSAAGIALPPSDAGAPAAYGAAAPSGGSAEAPAAGAGGAEGPAAASASGPAADAPASGGSAAASGPAAAADAPAAAAAAAASGPSGATAPSSSGAAAGAPGPSSGAAAGAPGPSSDDDAEEDGDDVPA